MSRLAASSAANLANDLSHALDVAEATNADLLQQLEEAEVVIAKVRKVRANLSYCPGDDDWDIGYAEGREYAADLLDGIDGL